MKETIQQFNLKWMRHEEHYGFMLSIAESVRLLTDEKTANVVGNFRAALQAEDDALQMEQLNDLTEQVVTARSDCNRALKSLRHLVLSASMQFDPTIVQAGKQLLKLLSRYTNPRRVPYLQAQGIYQNLLQDLHAEPYASHIATIQGERHLAALQERYDQFNNLFYERNARAAALGKSRAKESRTAVDIAWRQLYEYVNALLQVDGATDPLVTFVKEINELIDNQRTVRAARATTLARRRATASTPNEAATAPNATTTAPENHSTAPNEIEPMGNGLDAPEI